MSRLSRQEMRRDEVREWIGQAFGWSSEHSKGILRVLGAVAAVALVGLAVYSFLGRRSDEAQRLLAEGMRVYSAEIVAEGEEANPDDPEAPSFVDEADRRNRAKELFTSAYERYGSTDAGQIAGVYLGEIAQEEGDSERARELWQGFVDRHEDHALVGSVWMNLFSLDRQSGAVSEVEGVLRGWLETESTVLPEDVILWELAVTLDQEGKDDEAQEILQRLVDDFPASPYVSEARQRLEAAS